MKKYKLGYTQGVYDMFHIGHLNIINKAKEQCDYLIVGVNSDELVKTYKNKTPIINEAERLEIIQNLKAVDRAIIVNTLNKREIWNKIHFEAIFIGDDWKGNKRWEETEKIMNTIGAKLIYLPYTKGISTSSLTETIKSISN